MKRPTASLSEAGGGIERVLAGGVTVASLVNSGGREIVGPGGVASAATISGGTLEIDDGGSTGSGAVTFAASGGGILQLDASIHFGGLVAGFGEPDFLDLRDIAFGSATTLSFTEAAGNTSGVLSVSDSVRTANITLLGQYAAGQFTTANDGHGGTLIGDPSPAAPTDPILASLAAVGSSGHA